MILTFGLPNPQTDLGGVLVLDVLQSEELELPGEVTLYPVEDGAEVSDHIFTGSDRLRLRGLVSGSALFDFSGAFGGVSARLADAVEALTALRDARETFEVSTGLRIYPDMAFATLRFIREGDGRGNWLRVEADMVRVVKVRLREQEVPERNAAPAARGRAGATATPAGRTSSSGSGVAETAGARNGPFETDLSAGADGRTPPTVNQVLRFFRPQ